MGMRMEIVPSVFFRICMSFGLKKDGLFLTGKERNNLIKTYPLTKLLAPNTRWSSFIFSLFFAYFMDEVFFRVVVREHTNTPKKNTKIMNI